jgi:hypothetical protein
VALGLGIGRRQDLLDHGAIVVEFPVGEKMTVARWPSLMLAKSSSLIFASTIRSVVIIVTIGRPGSMRSPGCALTAETTPVKGAVIVIFSKLAL